MASFDRHTDLRTVDETFATLRTLVSHPLRIMGNAVQSIGCYHRAAMI